MGLGVVTIQTPIYLSAVVVYNFILFFPSISSPLFPAVRRRVGEVRGYFLVTISAHLFYL
jgi:hypothetical protein